MTIPLPTKGKVTLVVWQGTNMVAVDTPTLSSPCGRLALVRALFDSQYHRFTQERQDIVLWWCGGASAAEEEFRPKINFLLKVWSDPNFRPFDNIKSSVTFLRQNFDTDFLIRLSTSQPGGITLSFRRKMGGSDIVHTRYYVNKNENIVDSDRHEHTTITSLGTWFSAYRFQSSSACPAGYVCPSNI